MRGALAALFFALGAGTAHAQVAVAAKPAFSVERFTPAPGGTTFLGVEEPDVPAAGRWAITWSTWLMSRPIVLRSIDTGEEARCFASYMRIHALEATGGLTYAEMGRFQSADDPGDAAGTNDEAEAAKDEEGNPISNGQRNIWINETALATALNVSYMAEQTSLFGIVVGIALLLTGIGLIVLAFAVFRGGSEPSAAAT